MTIGQSESTTQQRVIQLFTEQLGYRYLGFWEERENNSNIEKGELTAFLKKQGHSPTAISRTFDKIRDSSSLSGRKLNATNQLFYEHLRYGVKVQTEAGKNTETVHLVDWQNPDNNDFAIAEEVSLKGDNTRRPDLVIYLNGIAVGVIELKNSRKDIGEGIRQLISNQKPQFHEWFFTTSQLLIAGNNTAGLRYGTTGTPEKYYLTWKENIEDPEGFDYKLDKYLSKLCAKERLLEIIHDCILFDGGVKKVPRVHQYFGLKAAQKNIEKQQGGIIWHTQGAGKSILMVLLAKWILENKPNARVVVVTDRDELDKQIERVFQAAGEEVHRTNSGKDLMGKLSKAKPRLLCSLVHKFGQRDVEDFEAFIEELKNAPSKTVGDVHVFVDECHRTQSGRLHQAMKAIMPNAIFIGFTGTPLLKKDKATTLEVFGDYIHTYKFSEAVDDKVVLDLVYEARDIDQTISSQKKIDEWFEAKTQGLNEWQKNELMKRWATMKRVLSSKGRMGQIVCDITHDFATKPRLRSERGNAILVASSIYEACRYYELFQSTSLADKCAVVTSYDPKASDISKEDIGENTDTDNEYKYKIYTQLLKDVTSAPNKSKTETYEDQAKKLFIEQPAQMKLLIVRDKLLTGFDAPSCTFLYIDKSMQDHGLFQAICRTNRLDGDDKDFGYIVDYKDLFTQVETAIAVYTSELDTTAGEDSEVLMKSRLTTGKERLENALEALEQLIEPVPQPRDEPAYVHYFCGNSEMASDLEEHQPLRDTLYKGTAELLRSYANLADELEKAGFNRAQQENIKTRLKYFTDLRETIRQAAGESIDLKPYEADMRHLIDAYINAEESRTLSPFKDLSLTELIVKTGIADAIAERLANKVGSKEGIAETIENNVRKKIVKEQLQDPEYYEKMSELLDEIIRQRREKAIEYEEYLKKIADLVNKVEGGQGGGNELPEGIQNSKARSALFRTLLKEESNGGVLKEVDEQEMQSRITHRTIALDEVIRTSAPADFRGNSAKENALKKAIFPLLDNDMQKLERIFEVIKQQPEY
ncbi:HsdR family type I site-specific deoxyribonuclease [Verrucomicrobiaceae bacterium R5-34]|nr:HsdR family type I site-specific deoxyribonuclease [Verrucomicrobiaceae bacterium R5-34]